MSTYTQVHTRASGNTYIPPTSPTPQTHPHTPHTYSTPTSDTTRKPHPLHTHTPQALPCPKQTHLGSLVEREHVGEHRSRLSLLAPLLLLLHPQVHRDTVGLELVREGTAVRVDMSSACIALSVITSRTYCTVRTHHARTHTRTHTTFTDYPSHTER